MTEAKFKEIVSIDEPTFGYKGYDYSVSSPDGHFYVWSEDSPGDTDLSFDTVDDLLDHWIIQGKPLREILPDIILN